MAPRMPHLAARAAGRPSGWLPIALVLAAGSCAGSDPGTNSTSTPFVATVNGPAGPANAPGQSLYLVRYEIAPGTRLRPHHHEGTQIGLVEFGVLTYHVLIGDVPVYRANADGRPVHDRTIRAGEFGAVAAGEWVVEEAGDHHWGANDETEPLVIFTSSLLREGAPLATPDPP